MLAGQKRKRSMSIGEAINKDKSPLNVARYTFALYAPQAIATMALDAKTGTCAVARTNGQLELWRTESWTMITALPSLTGTFPLV